MAISLLKTQKGKIEYIFLGKGPPILFVHGGHVNCREMIFHKGLESGKFCFIKPSRPGYGQTPITEANKTPAGTADLFIALLDELKISKVSVIGISAGGLTALEIAGRHPDRVDRLVLMSAITQKWFPTHDKIYKGSKRLFDPKIEALTWGLYRLFFKIFTKVMTSVMFKQLSDYRPVKYTKGELEELKAMTLNMRSGKGFSNDLDQQINQSLLSQIKCPTLILHSENDHAVNLSHARNAKNAIKNSNLLTFKNRWGHLLWLGDAYTSVLITLKEFLEK